MTDAFFVLQSTYCNVVCICNWLVGVIFFIMLSVCVRWIKHSIYHQKMFVVFFFFTNSRIILVLTRRLTLIFMSTNIFHRKANEIKPEGYSLSGSDIYFSSFILSFSPLFMTVTAMFANTFNAYTNGILFSSYL